LSHSVSLYTYTNTPIKLLVLSILLVID